MRNSLHTAVRRGVTVLIGSAVFALIASGAPDAATVTHGTDKAQTFAYKLGTFDGERDGSDVYVVRRMDRSEDPDPWWCRIIERCKKPD